MYWQKMRWTVRLHVLCTNPKHPRYEKYHLRQVMSFGVVMIGRWSSSINKGDGVVPHYKLRQWYDVVHTSGLQSGHELLCCQSPLSIFNTKKLQKAFVCLWGNNATLNRRIFIYLFIFHLFYLLVYRSQDFTSVLLKVKCLAEKFHFSARRRWQDMYRMKSGANFYSGDEEMKELALSVPNQPESVLHLWETPVS